MVRAIRKVSHTKIVSLTQWLEEDKSIFRLGHTVKRKSNILQTTYLKFNIPRKRFTSDLKLRFKNLKTYLNGKHLKHRWELWAILEVREVKHSAKKADLSYARGGNIFF